MLENAAAIFIGTVNWAISGSEFPCGSGQRMGVDESRWRNVMGSGGKDQIEQEHVGVCECPHMCAPKGGRQTYSTSSALNSL